MKTSTMILVLGLLVVFSLTMLGIGLAKEGKHARACLRAGGTIFMHPTAGKMCLTNYTIVEVKQ